MSKIAALAKEGLMGVVSNHELAVMQNLDLPELSGVNVGSETLPDGVLDGVSIQGGGKSGDIEIG